MIESFRSNNNLMISSPFGGSPFGGSNPLAEMSALLQALTASISSMEAQGAGQMPQFGEGGSLPGLANLGQTNPFFNAGFAGGLGGFFGGEGGEGGHFSETETLGSNGRPTAVDIKWNATPPPPPQNHSLAGATVWGDPHIKDANGGKQDFKSPDGLFINSNGSAVLVEADASNKETNGVQAFTPGQAQFAGIDADPNKVQVYEQVNGCMKDLGSAASLGFRENDCDKGTNVAANSTLNIGGGVDVHWDPNAAGTGSTVTFTQQPTC